jgi:hypothetical protein
MGDFENATGPLIDFLNNYDPPDIALFPYDTDTRLRIGDSFYAQGNMRMPWSITVQPSVLNRVAITPCSRWLTATTG